MHAKKWLLMVINFLGGAAVLKIYAHGFLIHPGGADILWGVLQSSTYVHRQYAPGSYWLFWFHGFHPSILSSTFRGTGCRKVELRKPL